MLNEIRSRFDFDKTVERIIMEAERREWNIPAVHDLQQSIAKAGKRINPVKVIEICKPAYSGKVLEMSDERIWSVMMPCRISVYIKEDGNTYAAVLNAAVLSSVMPESVVGIMQTASEETYEIAKTVA